MLLVLGACAPAAPRVHEAYVWQRVWSEEVRRGVSEGRGVFGGLRINAAAIGVEGTLVHPVDLASLGGVPVRIVVRVDAGYPVDVGERVIEVADRWRAAGIEVVGVEIDHDCPTAALPAYAEAVTALRARLPADLRLSVTLLPTWSESPALDRLLAAADEGVLQVHAVDAGSLFDPDRARVAVDRYLDRTDRPLWVAVPAYGMQVRGRELRVDAAAVTRFVGSLDRRVAGVVWFRLPAGDPRDWPLRAIALAKDGQVPAGRWVVRVEPARPGLYDVSIANDGLAWVPLPDRLDVIGECGAADGAGGYRIDRIRGLSWVRDDPGPLDPGAGHPVGWVRCDGPPEVR